MNDLSVLLQVATPAGGGMGSYGNILMIVAMIAVFYLFLIRPQQKRQKEERKFRESLQSGADVIVSGGIYGKIKEVKERSFIVEIAENTRIKVEKSSVFPAPNAEAAK